MLYFIFVVFSERIIFFFSMTTREWVNWAWLHKHFDIILSPNVANMSTIKQCSAVFFFKITSWYKFHCNKAWEFIWVHLSDFTEWNHCDPETLVSLLVLLPNALPQFVQHDRFSLVSYGHVTLFSISQNSQLWDCFLSCSGISCFCGRPHGLKLLIQIASIWKLTPS